MNSEEQTAPPQGVAVVTTPKGEQHSEGQGPGTRRRRRHRNRRHKHKHRQKLPAPHSQQDTTPEDRPPVTEGTELHQARQNHSTYDRDLHHRARGGTGYGYRRDVTQPESELRGDQLPPGVLPSYEAVLRRAGVTRFTEDSPPDTVPVTEPTITDAQQLEWEEQQMRQAHEQDQQNPNDTDEDEELKR